MKSIKYFFTFCLLLTIHINFVYAKDVSVAQARKVAVRYYFEKVNYFETTELTEIKIIDEFVESDNNSNPLFYVFNINHGGFVIVAADDRSFPVLAYSFTGKYSAKNQPPAFNFWMNSYKEQISGVRKQNIIQNARIEDCWNEYQSYDPLYINNPKTNKAVQPFITTHWNQSNYYNSMCPADSAGPGGHALAGCVPVAMGQIMCYYRYPQQGTGSYGYFANHSSAGYGDYGYLSADFANTTYRWSEMPTRLDDPNNAIGELLYHLGVSVDLWYGPNGSGMFNHKAAYAMRTNFGYSPNTEYIFRDSTTINWKDTLFSHLDNKKPLYYAGWADTTFTSGHAFVCDGYQDTSFFHFNWGWGGSNDGYFNIDNLTFSVYNFSMLHEMIANIYPDSNYPYYCAGPDTITSTSGSIEDGSGPLHDYQDNASCSWLIAPVDSVNDITLEFLNFETQSNSDIVTVYDGTTTSDPVLGTFSGTNSYQVTSSSNRMLITFTSDNNTTSPGFLAEFTSSIPVYCNGVTNLTAPSGTFSDGSGSYDYHDRTICFWTINPPGATSITLGFNYFETEPVADFVRVINNDNGDIINTFSGDTVPPTITVNTSSLRILFLTSTTETFDGWEATYTSSSTGAEGQTLNNFSLYPNPANSALFLRYSLLEQQNMTIKIIDITGKELIAGHSDKPAGDHTNRIDVSELTQGVYILHLVCGNDVTNKKFIITK